ncbi:hypothetical protein [Marinobacter salexigens]|uniref:RiboL-PSP-HEPN domain-containing protein n=1 Tax=Marinobacter salexigens TaxID=1925763 RepID=A0ABS6ACP5_9GAMM|nr:hypothetical protein [Marinobacter salexigens]MBU2875937.1 hypothetical protein [Marinobacter salexigens]
MDYSKRNRAVHAIDLLNDFVGDCVASVMVLHEYRRILHGDEEQITALVAIQKMCLSYLILTLNKWLEFYDKYSAIIPDELRVECKALTKTLRQKKVNQFRNKCIGHIWDKTNQRPLHNSEINENLDIIVGDDLEGFLDWANNPKGNVYPNTFLSIVEELRNRLMKDYNCSYEEIKSQ